MAMVASPPFSFSVFDGAALTQNEPGTIDLTTPGANYGPALLARPTEVPGSIDAVVKTRVRVELELQDGKIGAILLNSEGGGISAESSADVPGKQEVVVECNGAATSLLLRSSDRGSAKARISRITWDPLRRFGVGPIIEEVLPALLRAPGDAALSAIARALSARGAKSVDSTNIGALDLSGPSLPMPIGAPPLERIFDDDVGRAVITETERLLALLPKAKLDKLGDFLSELDANFYAKYFKATISRVYHLVHLLRELGMHSGTVLEIGSLMGNFSATLQRLGYQVTAVDRYRFYEGGLDAYTEYMRALGIQVEEMTREDELERISALGQYDAVISMAVIEHIPPPARPFLEMLAAHVKPGGLLLLDTPNIAHYWNRIKLSKGESIHQDLKMQYHTNPPWEGHYREYTPSELRWMLEQVGCTGIKEKLFDVFMMQWEEFWPDKLQELLNMSLDTTLCATMLAGGRISRH